MDIYLFYFSAFKLSIMKHKGQISLLRPTTTKHDVPVLFQEPHVETGFRHPHQPWFYYICSIFQKHNECMNVWTHLIGLLLTVSRTIEFSNEYDLIGNPHMWPLSAGLITMVLMYLCSTCAHCFSHKSELVHYTGFMIDYAGIGIFGLGSTIIHYAYCIHDTMLNSSLKMLSVPIGVILGALVCICCTVSKVFYKRPYPFTRKIWQIGSVGGIYTWLSLPILHRLFLDKDGEDVSLYHHTSQMIWFALAGFFFGSDIPQRFFPGKFDFVGHSHQIFHICIILVTQKQLDGVHLDIEKYHRTPAFVDEPSFMETFGAVISLTIVCFLNVLLFHNVVKYRLGKENVKQE